LRNGNIQQLRRNENGRDVHPVDHAEDLTTRNSTFRGMQMKKLGKLNEIGDIRQIWPNEATDFTPWLSKEENIAILAEEIGIDITVSETESAVDDFAVDIFGTETGTERKVVIENQLEDSNHDHLGKLLTYAAGQDSGLSFGWHELPGKKASEITIERTVDFDNSLTRQSDFKWITDTMLKMAPAFKKCLAKIPKETA